MTIDRPRHGIRSTDDRVSCWPIKREDHAMTDNEDRFWEGLAQNDQMERDRAESSWWNHIRQLRELAEAHAAEHVCTNTGDTWLVYTLLPEMGGPHCASDDEAAGLIIHGRVWKDGDGTYKIWDDNTLRRDFDTLDEAVAAVLGDVGVRPASNGEREWTL